MSDAGHKIEGERVPPQGGSGMAPSKTIHMPTPPAASPEKGTGQVPPPLGPGVVLAENIRHRQAELPRAPRTQSGFQAQEVMPTMAQVFGSNLFPRQELHPALMAQTAGGHAGMRQNAKAMLLARVRMLRDKADRLQALACAIPDNLPQEADQALWELIQELGSNQK